jgi:hypothetical protein
VSLFIKPLYIYKQQEASYISKNSGTEYASTATRGKQIAGKRSGFSGDVSPTTACGQSGINGRASRAAAWGAKTSLE